MSTLMAYLGLFITAFLAGSFVPLGSEPGLLLLKSQGFAPWMLLFVASIGNTMGGMTFYVLCRLGKQRFLRLSQDKLKVWQLRMQSRTELFALLCWLPLVGELIAGALGIISKRWRLIAIYMLIGKSMRYLMLLYFYDVITQVQ